MFSSFTTRDRLRRSMSTRSMRRARPQTESESVDVDVAKSHAATAATRAMRLNERSSLETKSSYDKLGGPGNVAIPRRRQNTSLQSTDDSHPAIPSIPPPLTPQRTDRDYIAQPSYENSAALPPITEFKGLDGRDSSVPSSYRRLRRAKSMFSTRQRLSQLAHGTPPIPHGSSPGPDFSPDFAMPRTLRNSRSFIRNRQQPHAIRRAKSQNVAVQLTPSQYLKENESLEVQTRRSSFLLSRRKGEVKPFRKSFRATSEGSGPNPSPGSFSSKFSHARSRTFSASIKHGLKRVFGLSKQVERSTEQPTEQPTEPLDELRPQNLAANVANVANDDNVSLVSYTETEEVHDEVVSSPLRVKQISPSRASICTTGSRSTSRTTSTVGNAVKARRTGHRQSLSLIEEHGDLNEQLSEAPYDTENNQSPSRKRSSTRNMNGWFNTQDLYTALMQQIGRNAAQDQEEIVLGIVPEHRVIPERVSSTYSRHSQRTVRRVSSEESSTSPESFATAQGSSMSPQKYQRSAGYIRPLRVSSRAVPEQKNTRSSYLKDKSPHAAHIMGLDSDGETGSVEIACSESRLERVSPTSVYSRTTGGNTPTKNADMLAPLEPGTATIFTSERTAWSSPSHASRTRASVPTVQPSADWLQWMSSQIERIENTSPIREHIRENAQFQDEDGIFTEMLLLTTLPGHVLTSPSSIMGRQNNKSQPADGPILPQSNYSRPFSRSSSVRTIISAQKIEPDQPFTMSTNNPEVDLTTYQAQTAPSWSQGADSPVSPMRIRTSNMIKIPESPTPPQRNGAGVMKRARTQDQYRRYSARRPMVNVKPNSFRSMRSQRDVQGLNDENTRQGEEHDDMMDEYHKLQDIHSTMSSKRMVDMFLDSRRLQMGMELPVNENTATEEAFI
ncbi:hypothetical protein N7520_000263 [Penicillium odoratum]|uniref:uncharacterized protein n=1 Tax=Penicillium odoratum TaxID=1167516 RepID=UPI002548C2F1|nr:uncharacterized protein N7520_000263 [Penicillium odoratum]KAJ5777017.1 hypothetical protein N7520_000263 [Penicillium odoratum]